MSSQEIMFWISLFGIDIGLPLMLPERWRFRTGAIMTALSAVGLAWSLGYHVSLQNHVGWQAAMVFMGIGGLASMISTVTREGILSLMLYDVAEMIELEATRIRRKLGEQPELHKMEWHRALLRYQKSGRMAAKLVFEIVPFASSHPHSPYYKLTKSLNNPESLDEVDGVVNELNTLAEMARKWRVQRFVSDALRGVIWGNLAFWVLHFVAVRMW